jgi:hypothetical protein
MSLITTNRSELNDCLKMAQIAEQAIDVAIAYKKENDEIYAKFVAAHAIWTTKRDNYVATLLRWTQRNGEFARFADYENSKRQFHPACVDRPGSGVCTANIGHNTDACVSHFGPEFIDSGNRTGCAGPKGFWDGCGGGKGNYSRGQRRECVRNPDIIARYAREYVAAKPILDPEPKYGDGAFPIKPIPPINIAMACCSNTINLSGNAEAKDNVQSCVMQVQQELARQEEIVETQPQPQPQPQPQHKDTYVKEKKSNNMIYIGGAGFVVLSVSSCICLIIIAIMMLAIL